MFRFAKTQNDDAAAAANNSSSHDSASQDSHHSGGDNKKHGSPAGTPQNSFRLSKPFPPLPTNNNNSTSHFIVAREDHSKLGTTVRQIMANPAICRRFMEFAASLHADEGLKFLSALQESYEVANQKEAASQLMHEYFLDDATNQVNLPDVIRSDLLDRFDRGKYNSVAELFNDATHEVFTDIKKSDTFRNFLMHDDEAKRISSDETLLLDGWIVSENFRPALQAVQEDETLSNLVRFCTSVSEYEKEEDKVAKKARGNKIAATFIQAGSTFQISSVMPQYYQDVILAGKYQLLPDARIESLQILAKNATLMEAVRRSLTQVRSSSARSYSNSATGPGQQSRTQDLQQCLTRGDGKKLVQKLMTETPPDDDILMMNKTRYCSAVASFLAMPGTCENNGDKLAAARKIVANYVQIGSMFQVDLASGFVEDLCSAKKPDYVASFSVIYQQFISDLGALPAIDKALDELSISS